MDKNETVIVHGSDVHVDRSLIEVPQAEVRHRFGGADAPAAAAGTSAAFGALVLLAGIAGGLGRIGYQQGLRDATTVTVTVLIVGLVVLVAAALVGGWTAGRAARYDGLRNGLLSAVLLVILTAGLGALASAAGSKYQVAPSGNLPTWVTSGGATVKAVLTGLIALLVMLAAGALGGRLGSRWHRCADDVLIRTRPGGLAPYPAEPALAHEPAKVTRRRAATDASPTTGSKR